MSLRIFGYIKYECDFNTGDAYRSIVKNQSVKTLTSTRPDIREVLALNLKFLRAKKGLSQDALALVAGLDRTFIAHVERLKRNISLDNLEKLAVALEVPTATLLDENLRQDQK